MNRRVVGSSSLAIVALLLGPDAFATSPAPQPALVEVLARASDEGWQFDPMPRSIRLVGWDARGERLTSEEERPPTPEERALLLQLAGAQREGDPGPFSLALRHPLPWIRDQAMAAFVNGRVAGGFGASLGALPSARRADVAAVLSLVPDLVRLAGQPPPARGGSDLEATPVLAVSCLLWLAHHLEGPDLERALTAAVDGITRTPHWILFDRLDDLVETHPTIVLSEVQRTRLLPVLRAALGVDNPREHEVGALLAHLRDAEGLDRLRAIYLRERFWPHVLSLAVGRHPKALDDVRAALDEAPEFASVQDWPLRAAAVLADGTLTPAVVRRTERLSRMRPGAEALVAIGTPEAVAALDALLRKGLAEDRSADVLPLAQGLLRKRPEAAAQVRTLLGAASPRVRIALAQALAEAHVPGMTPVVLAAVAAQDTLEARIEGARALVAAAGAGDAEAVPALSREVDRAEQAVRSDWRRRSDLAVASAIGRLPRVPVELERRLIALWDSPVADTFLRADIAYALGSGGPESLAFLAPQVAYGRPSAIREAARVSYGRLERRD